MIGGQFTTVGGMNLPHIAAWNGSSWRGLGAGFDDEVSALLAIEEGPNAGARVAGGDFYNSGETSVSRIAIWR